MLQYLNAPTYASTQGQRIILLYEIMTQKGKTSRFSRDTFENTDEVNDSFENKPF